MKIFFTILLVFSCLIAKSQSVIITTREPIKIKDKADPFGNVIASIATGESISIVSYNAGYYSVEYNGKSGYVSEIFIADDVKLKPIKAEYLKLHPERKKNTEIFTGMSTRDLVDVWGDPKAINKTTGPWGVHEQWVYVLSGGTTKYYYFENGKLTATSTIE